MKTHVTVGLLLLGLLGVRAVASPAPCRFGGFDGDDTFEDIGATYNAADIVVIGTVTDEASSDGNLLFSVRQVIKGSAAAQITLRAHRVQNTEINGFLLPHNRSFLLFLVQGTSSLFDGVEIYNSGCISSYPVRGANVVFVEADEHNRGIQVPVSEVKRFLLSNPPKLIHKYR